MKKIINVALATILSLNMAGVVFAEYDRTELDTKYDELISLIKKCENRGINVDSERVMAATVKRFTDNIVFDAMLDENLKNEGTSLKEKTNRSVSYQESALNELYNKAKANLDSYLKCEKTSKSVDSPYNSEFLEMTENGIEIADAPYYSLGYGHFNSVLDDIPIMESMGADHVATEIGPINVMEIVSTGYQSYTCEGAARDKTVKRLQELLAEAEKSEVGINLLLSPHYMPEWFLNWYPELECSSVAWCGYNIFHDKAKEVLAAYLAAVLPALKDYSALESVILTNEPSLVTYTNPDIFKTDFNRYLVNKYGKISVLNEAWGTSYTSWSSINMPVYDTNTELPVTYDALFYDWYIYNDEKFAEWHEWMANEVRKHLPDVKISIKTLDYLWCNDNSDTYRLRGITGNDVERYAEFCDFAGVDAHGNISDYSQIIQKYMYYDFVRSLTGQPIYNSEDHMFYDSYKTFGDKDKYQDEHVATSIWQGALHGMEKTTLWTWQRLDYTPGYGETWTDAIDRELKSIYNATFLHRPEAAAAAGITAVNLRRLNDEVRALETAKNNTAVLYSKSARIYNLDFISEMHSAYETMIAAGFGVDFVSEYKPERMHNYDTLVLTGVNNIESNTLKELYEFSQNGGNVILLNSSIENNQYNRPGVDEYISSIKNSKNTVLIEGEGLYEALKNADTRKVKAELLNAEGELAKGIDFKWTENYDGSILVNICNLTNESIKNLTLYIDDKPVSATDLINGTAIEPGFTAKRYTPLLIYIPGNGGFLRNISVKNGTISWQRELFPAYVYSITDGMENKKLVAIEENRFEGKKEGIYYIRKSDSGVVYPGKIVSLQTETLFAISETETGYKITNISDKYAAGVLALRYDGITPSGTTFINIYLEPGEDKYITAKLGAVATVYNNMSDFVKISY